MISIFNEEEYALNVLNNGFSNNKQWLDLFILAKYYKFKCNKTRKECKELLKSFCIKQVDDYEHGDLYKKVNSVINKVYNKKIKFLNIDYIEFNKYELDYINTLSLSDIGKQLLFCLWCCNKINIKAGQSDKWIKIEYSDLKAFCNFKSGTMTSLLNELYKNNLIFISDSCAICLTFLDDYSNYFNKITYFKDREDVSPIESYFIDDFTTCGLWWRKYNNDKKVINCKECGILMVRNSNRQKYCKDCARDKELEKQIRYNSKR